MASKPGILTEWPWTFLGNFKYILLAPFAAQNTYKYCMEREDLSSFLIFPFLLLRILHNQFWISFSRYRTAKGDNRIVDKTIEFEQVDRETNWDDNILLNGLIFYVGTLTVKNGTNLPMWRTDGVIMTILLHIGPVEFLYYWLHRALHHHFLYSRYHSHHHSSIATEPITSVVHPFGEHLAYFALFAIPLYTTVFTKTASVISFAGYVMYIDIMNNLGHCNFEFIPKWLFSAFPPLKYIMYTPSYHSLHHTQFRTNYSLFMPFYDYIYNTIDKSSDELYESSLQKAAESPEVVHLTHLTTPESIFHIRVGLAGVASRPYSASKWYFLVMWPITLWSTLVTRIWGSTFVVERNIFKDLKLQTWAIPRYSIQYSMRWQREPINNLIEEAILDAEKKGTKVLSLGLLNQDEELNKCGDVLLRKHPQLNVKIVDGSSLAVGVVLNSIPKGTTQVVVRGNLSKVACAVSLALCKHGIKVVMLRQDEYKKLEDRLGAEVNGNLILSKNSTPKVWLVGDGLSEEEHVKAPKGTIFIPFSQFPPRKMRRDCYYYHTPSMIIPKHLQNVDSCENWLPRRVMSAWRIAGILHATEGWNVNECGSAMFDVDKIWEASLKHGFRPLTTTSR